VISFVEAPLVLRIGAEQPAELAALVEHAEGRVHRVAPSSSGSSVEELATCVFSALPMKPNRNVCAG